MSNKYSVKNDHNYIYNLLWLVFKIIKESLYFNFIILNFFAQLYFNLKFIMIISSNPVFMKNWLTLIDFSHVGKDFKIVINTDLN
jgi:hypothetical protein